MATARNIQGKDRRDAARGWATRLAQAWSALRRRLSDRYEPARHYMRGPGPKTRERQARGAPPRGS